MTAQYQHAGVGSEAMNKTHLRQAIAARRGMDLHAIRPPRLLRVLVIDDDRDCVEAICRLVNLWGHDHRRAYDAVSGLEVAATFRPDLILLDIGMPGIDGCQMAREIRLNPRLQHCFIVAVTGHGDESQRDICRAAGVDLMLVKPVDPVVLETLLGLEDEYANRKAR
jgi:CheY-like chemotaxis protein